MKKAIIIFAIMLVFFAMACGKDNKNPVVDAEVETEIVEAIVEEPVDLNPYNFERVLQNGSDGQDVKKLQERLHQLGYSSVIGAIDGDFGRRTEGGIKEIQGAMGTTQTGIVDRDLWDTIFNPENTERISSKKSPIEGTWKQRGSDIFFSFEADGTAHLTDRFDFYMYGSYSFKNEIVTARLRRATESGDSYTEERELSYNKSTGELKDTSGNFYVKQAE